MSFKLLGDQTRTPCVGGFRQSCLNRSELHVVAAAKNNMADRIPAATRRYSTPSSTSFTADPNEQRKLLSPTPAGISYAPRRPAAC